MNFSVWHCLTWYIIPAALIAFIVIIIAFFVLFIIKMFRQYGKFYVPKVTVTKSSDYGNTYKNYLPPVLMRKDVYLKYEIAIKTKNKFGADFRKALPVTLETPKKEELEVSVYKCTGKYMDDTFNTGEIWFLASTHYTTMIILKCRCVKDEDMTYLFKMKIEDGALHQIHFETDTVEYVKCGY